MLHTLYRRYSNVSSFRFQFRLFNKNIFQVGVDQSEQNNSLGAFFQNIFYVSSLRLQSSWERSNSWCKYLNACQQILTTLSVHFAQSFIWDLHQNLLQLPKSCRATQIAPAAKLFFIYIELVI